MTEWFITPVIRKVELRNVGPIHNISMSFSPGLNIIFGGIATGKTTLIESLYYAVSQKGRKPEVKFGETKGHIRVKTTLSEITLRLADNDVTRIETELSEQERRRGFSRDFNAILIDTPELSLGSAAVSLLNVLSSYVQVIVTTSDLRFLDIPAATTYILEREEDGIVCLPYSFMNEAQREVLSLKRIDVETNKERLKRFFSRLESASISENFVFVERNERKLKFGFEEVSLAEYFYIPESFVKHAEKIRNLSDYYFLCAYRFIKPGKYALWLGRYLCRLEVKEDGWYLEGIKIPGEAPWRLMTLIHNFFNRSEDVREYLSILRFFSNAEEVAAKVAEVFNNGIILPTTKGERRYALRLKVFERGSEIHIAPDFSPEDSVPIKGDPTFVLKVWRESLIHINEAAERLKMRIGSEVVERWMESALKKQEEAERRSRKLLMELVDKHSDKVLEVRAGSEEGELMGYLVKGERKYFVTLSGEVFAYPEMRHICLVEEDRSLPACDRIIARILTLLNDTKLKSCVSTLE